MSLSSTTSPHPTAGARAPSSCLCSSGGSSCCGGGRSWPCCGCCGCPRQRSRLSGLTGSSPAPGISRGRCGCSVSVKVSRLEDDGGLSSDFIAIETPDDTGHGQSLWVAVRNGWHGNDPDRMPTVQILYQEEHMASQLAGPVFLS